MNVVVLGGHGAIGRIFVNELVKSGYHTIPIGRDDWTKGTAQTYLSWADMVILSAPLDKTIDILHEVVKYIKPTTILTDVSSVKAPIMRAMLDMHTGPVVGLHPMFGPDTPTLEGQKVIVCLGRGDCTRVANFLKGNGADLVYSTPVEHDEMMVVVQAIRFFLNLVLGSYLSEGNINLSRLMEFASPMFSIQMSMTIRLLNQDPHLYSYIMTASGDYCIGIDKLNKISNRLSRLVQEKDTMALSDEFKFVRNFLLSKE